MHRPSPCSHLNLRLLETPLETNSGYASCHYKYSTISKLMKTLLLLPHSNADSERVFSMVNKISTEHRADLAQHTVAALLSVKVNSRVDSQRFEPSINELSKAKSATMEYNRLNLHVSRVRLLNHLWTNLILQYVC